VFRDLEYLLTFQGYEDNASIAKYVGSELSVIRQSQNKTQAQVAEALGLKKHNVMAMENGSSVGRPFVLYWRYCYHLGLTFSELFTRAHDTQCVRRTAWSTKDLLAEVNRVFPILAASGKRVTQLNIAYEIGIALGTLKKHGKVRERLTEISAQSRSNQFVV
jgi:DNA-binding XRE family transcriptional regulator